ncbi:hypothetical protein ACMFMG_004024 [Clarireedia jacksonii]
MKGKFKRESINAAGSLLLVCRPKLSGRTNRGSVTENYRISIGLRETHFYSNLPKETQQVTLPHTCRRVSIRRMREERPNRADDYCDALTSNAASQFINTMVIIHSTVVRLLDTWIGHPNITAAIFTHLPGMASGAALVDSMYGEWSSSGWPSYTVAKNECATKLSPLLDHMEQQRWFSCISRFPVMVQAERLIGFEKQMTNVSESAVLSFPLTRQGLEPMGCHQSTTGAA